MAPVTTSDSLAIVIGATGGIGAALVDELQSSGLWGAVVGLGRNSLPSIDLTIEDSVRDAAHSLSATSYPLRLIVNATGVLGGKGCVVEKSLRQIDPEAMRRAFMINSIGPALLMKHFLPLLARDGRSVFATLSARVGSIGDNRLGGWYSYRASKAAQNQLVRSAAVELKRSHPGAICVAIHPGTVDTSLTRGYAKTGLDVQTPAVAAQRILGVLDDLDIGQSGGFFDNKGLAIPW